MDEVRDFSREHRINYPILYAGDKAQDVVDSVGGFRGIPTTFLLDRDGKVLKKVTGLMDKDFWEKEIERIL